MKLDFGESKWVITLQVLEKLEGIFDDVFVANVKCILIGDFILIFPADCLYMSSMKRRSSIYDISQLSMSEYSSISLNINVKSDKNDTLVKMYRYLFTGL